MGGGERDVLAIELVQDKYEWNPCACHYTLISVNCDFLQIVVQ